MPEMKKLICVGDLCCDLLVPYGKMKEALSKGDISMKTAKRLQVAMRVGGSVGNLVRVLGHLGEQPIFVTPLLEDELGRFLKQELIDDRVDMRYTAPSIKSNMYCIAVLDETGERTMFCFVPPWADVPSFTKESFDPALYTEPAIVFTSGMALTNDRDNNEAVLSFVREMKTNGSKVVFDLNIRAESYGFCGNRKASFGKMLCLADIVLGSGKDEFLQLSGEEAIEKAIPPILDKMGEDGTVIVRDGQNPVRIVRKDKTETIRVKAVRIVSTVGAGDAFDAGFLSGIRRGASRKESAEYAVHLAGHYISHEGADRFEFRKIR